MRFLLCCLICLYVAPGSPLAGQRSGFSKIDWLVWGTINIPPEIEGISQGNAKAEIYLRPEATLVQWTERTSLVAYGLLGVLKDRNRFDFNNRVEGSVGLEVQHQLSPAVRLSFGGRYSVEREFSSGRSNSAIQFTADGNVWKTWQPAWIARRLPDQSRLILHGWSTFRYPSSLDPFERRNGLLQGQVKFAVELPLRQTRFRVAPFLSLKGKWDIRKRDYNNLVEPAFGVDLKLPLADNGEISLGIKAAFEYRYETDVRRSGEVAYISWYKRF